MDTYDTLQGVRHAVAAGERLRARGYKLGGIRLDSGDLAYLSIEARKILDAGGFTDTAVLATNDLDENLITSLKAQGARIDTWAVGTRLVTAYDQPALGGVYKLGAIRPTPDARTPRRWNFSSCRFSAPGGRSTRCPRWRKAATARASNSPPCIQASSACSTRTDTPWGWNPACTTCASVLSRKPAASFNPTHAPKISLEYLTHFRDTATCRCSSRRQS